MSSIIQSPNDVDQKGTGCRDVQETRREVGAQWIRNPPGGWANLVENINELADFRDEADGCTCFRYEDNGMMMKGEGVLSQATS